MINSDLIFFLENSDTLTSFDRKKKIYELTNNLDLDLLEDLRKEIIYYYKDKFEESLIKHKEEFGDFKENEVEDEKPTIYNHFINIHNFSINEFIDNYLNQYEYQWIEDIIDKTSKFTNDLDELLIRSLKLPKNAEIAKDKETEEAIDFSDTSITSKIIFLEKLGIIEFLRKKSPFNTSINSLATVISAFTGAKSTSIQPLLNAMLSKDTSDKNNPLKSINTVKTVNNKLINIGFNPN